MDTHTDNEKPHASPSDASKTHKKHKWFVKPLTFLAILLVAGAVLYGLFVGYAYAATPAAIRAPKFQHYHFRMQILVNGKAQNFSEKEFQTDTAKDICSANLTKQPFHFHDDKDQMVHVHWDSMSGGLVLKYYGWNYVGGTSNSLGYRFDSFPKLVKVPIHGDVLPKIATDDNFYVFTGDEHSYKAQKWEDFLHKDFETFFGKKSNLPDPTKDTGLIDKLFPKAYAHGDDEVQTTAATSATPQELQRINNLLGNVVIFVQKDKPTDAQIKDRFDKLAPLSLSTCAG